MKACLMSLIFSLSVLLPLDSSRAQPQELVIDLDKAIDGVRLEGEDASRTISRLFGSLNTAIAKTETLAVMLGNADPSNLDAVIEAITVLSTEVLPVYSGINASRDKTRAILDSFATTAMGGRYKLADINQAIKEDMARHNADRAAIMTNEPLTSVATLRLGYLDRTVDLLRLLDEYIDTAQVRLEHVQQRLSLTNEDIEIFFVACEENEKFLRYHLMALQVYHNVESFLQAVEGMSGLKEVVKRSSESLLDLNEEVRQLIETRMRQLPFRERADSTSGKRE